MDSHTILDPATDAALHLAYPTERLEEFDLGLIGPEELARPGELASALHTLALVQVDLRQRCASDRSHILVLSLPNTPPFNEWVHWGSERQVRYMSRAGVLVEYYWLRVSFVLPVWQGTPNSWYANSEGYTRIRDEFEMLAPDWPASEADMARVLGSFGYRHMPREEQFTTIPWLLSPDWDSLDEDAGLDAQPPLEPSSLGCAVFDVQ